MAIRTRVERLWKPVLTTVLRRRAKGVGKFLSGVIAGYIEFGKVPVKRRENLKCPARPANEVPTDLYGQPYRMTIPAAGRRHRGLEIVMICKGKSEDDVAAVHTSFLTSSNTQSLPEYRYAIALNTR